MHGSCWPLTLVSDETVSALHVLVLKIVSWIYFFPATRAIWLNVSVASSVARSKKKKKRNFGVLPLLADTQKESRKRQEKMLATGLSTGLVLRPLFRQVFLFLCSTACCSLACLSFDLLICAALTDCPQASCRFPTKVSLHLLLHQSWLYRGYLYCHSL